MPRKNYICSHCENLGEDDFVARNALLGWNADQQEWVVVMSWATIVCFNCEEQDRDYSIKEVLLDEVTP